MGRPQNITPGQVAVGKQLEEELAESVPMRRLLQGDVGSGKTVVALRAMLQAVDCGHQAVLIAPTEVLASQHTQTFTKLLGPLGRAGQLGAGEQSTWVELLTGALSAAQRRKTLAKLASGEPGIVVGTHALLEDSVQLPGLALVVVDEQHRFGVDQRDKLAKGAHLLVMTATPIPRTIAMTFFGELETSTLRELPAGRQPITTTLVPAAKQNWVDRMWHRAREEVAAGGRVYVVCPRIDDADEVAEASGPKSPDLWGNVDTAWPAASPATPAAGPATVSGVFRQLQAEPALCGVEIGFLHGRLCAEEKALAMERFASGKAPILVTTTVIEVGVDVPEASMMIILDAGQFGISQLHQLRGRVGRGTRPSICLAVHSAPSGSIAANRLAAFSATTDGFELAEKDLELRSEGDVLGSAQSGKASTLRFLQVSRHQQIIAHARNAARELVAADPELSDYPELKAAVESANNAETQYLERS